MKVFNVTTTPTVSPALPIETVLEAGARIVGVVLDPGALGSAAFVTYLNFSIFSTVMAQGNASGANKIKQWWAGWHSQDRAEQLLTAGPAVDTVAGYIPLGCPNFFPEKFTGQTYQLTLQIATTVDGQVFVFYTTDPPTQYGEHP